MHWCMGRAVQGAQVKSTHVAFVPRVSQCAASRGPAASVAQGCLQFPRLFQVLHGRHTPCIGLGGDSLRHCVACPGILESTGSHARVVAPTLLPCGRLLDASGSVPLVQSSLLATPA